MSDDGLDIEQPQQLLRYLEQTQRVEPGELLTVRVLAGGVSNRTVWVERAGGEAWVLKQALAKLRVKVDWFSSPERVHREALGLRWLAQLAPAGTITPLVFEDHDHHLLAMEAVPQPHDNWKTLLLAGQIELDHVQQFGRLLGTMHRTSWQQREQLSQVFADRSFFESLRLEPYYQYTAEQVPQAADFLTRLIAETRGRRWSLVHGDFSPKNVLVRKGQLVLLDHEVIHFGDPAFDLGFALAHLLSKAHHLPAQRGQLRAAAAKFWRAYETTLADVAWANPVQQHAVEHTAACLLARVAGRSPLEYLNENERQRQLAGVCALLPTLPASIEPFADAFLARM